MLTVRFASVDDLQILPEIERHAGEVFRSLGMDSIADDDPIPAQHLIGYQQAGDAWVAEDAARFRRDPDPDQSPELREIRRAEAARGLSTWPRVAMRRQLK